MHVHAVPMYFRICRLTFVRSIPRHFKANSVSDTQNLPSSEIEKVSDFCATDTFPVLYAKLNCKKQWEEVKEKMDLGVDLSEKEVDNSVGISAGAETAEGKPCNGQCAKRVRS
jgi:hypothetical protein